MLYVRVIDVESRSWNHFSVQNGMVALFSLTEDEENYSFENSLLLQLSIEPIANEHTIWNICPLPCFTFARYSFSHTNKLMTSFFYNNRLILPENETKDINWYPWITLLKHQDRWNYDYFKMQRTILKFSDLLGFLDCSFHLPYVFIYLFVKSDDWRTKQKQITILDCFL